MFLGGAIRDGIQHLAQNGAFGAIGQPSLGYTFVYHTEIGLLFATLIALGPLVRLIPYKPTQPDSGTGLRLTEFPT